MASSSSSDTRPLSPHVQIWRWHATMAASIAHRVSGCVIYFGSALIAAIIISLATGPEAYAFVMDLVLSIPGRLVLFGFTAALTYHFFNGLRHLIWDGPGAGFSPKVASTVSILNFILAIAATFGIWALAYFG